MNYTKEYIESTTGMTFQEFLDVVKKYSDSQNINFETAQRNLLAGNAVGITLDDVTQNTNFYGTIEPAAQDEETDTQQGAINDALTPEQAPQTIIEQVIQSQPASNNHTSHNTHDTISSAAFERPMVDSTSLSTNAVFQSNATISATDLSYSNPVSVTADNTANASPVNTSPIIVEIQNIEPSARYDIFFGNINTDISGNLIADNGYGADTDLDGSILTAVAGTFATDQGGVVTILESGDFTYTPANGHSGVDTFSYSIEDSNGAIDTAEVTFALSTGDTTTAIDFSTTTFSDYGVTHNYSDLFFVEDQGDTLQLLDNTWKDISLDYTVTADTVLEFDFMSTDIGEIQGIGFDTNDSISSNLTFKLYGTQNWGESDFNTYAGNEGEWVHYTINVGDYYTGDFNRMFFVMDNDTGTSSNSFFSNITIHEPSTAASETVTGTSAAQSLYGNDGDDVIYGLDGDDVLYGGSGIDFLYGGNGADTFVFDDAFDIDHVHDFNAAEGDSLDLSALLSGYDAVTDAINDFIQVTSDGHDTFVAIDSDGGADNFVQVATLHGITNLDTPSDLEASGTLII